MMKAARQLECAVFGIVTLACCTLAAAQTKNTEPEVIFGLESVCSVKDQAACIRLGSPWNVHALKKALPAFEVEYAQDCEEACFIVKRGDTGFMEVFGRGDTVYRLESSHAASDFRGILIGDRLIKAVGPEATCSAGYYFECWSDSYPQLTYIAEGCEITLSGTKDSERVAIPECAVVSGFVLTAQASIHLQESTAYVPEFVQYPAGKAYSGKTRMPDFSGRDRAFREYRTKIREGLAEQKRSNFAGRYNAVRIGLTGGFVLAIVESATGRVIWSDVLGGGPYYEYDFKPDSTLLVMQWSNGESCHLGRFEWTGAQMKDIGQPLPRPTDADGNCKEPLPNALYPFDR